MKLSPFWIAALALAASCTTAAPAPEAHVHAAGTTAPHACEPPDVPADPADALTHTPHTPGRPEIRYYVISDA